MPSSKTLISILSLLSVALAKETTVTGVSQISDGQVQAPPSATGSDASVATVSITSASYENPFTIYTSMTDSLGVITGMPSVVTSQPAVVTSQPSQPSAATLPTTGPYANTNTTSTTESISPTLPTTLSTSTLVETPSEQSGASGSSTASGVAQATGGAIANKVAGAGIGLIVLGMGFSLL